MDIRFVADMQSVKSYDTTALREKFLIPEVFKDDEITAVYSLHDRMIILGARPLKKALALPAFEMMTKAGYFLERREIGIINVGQAGAVTADGEKFTVGNKECLYIGKGVEQVIFESADPANPAEFYMNSAPAHAPYPVAKAGLKDVNRIETGAKDTSNERTIYQYIHEKGIQSCQLVMGLTILKSPSIWNTFPPHTHLRRMEAYLYFEVPEDQLIFHFMGEPTETRHIVMRNKQAVISPEWSIHSGVGTASYSFIWGMAGENKAFTDMDGVKTGELR